MDEMVQCHPKNNKSVPWATLNLGEVQTYLSAQILSVTESFKHVFTPMFFSSKQTHKPVWGYVIHPMSLSFEYLFEHSDCH